MSEPVSEYELLLEQARLGEEAKAFLSGNLGKHLIRCIEGQERASLNELRSVDPFDSKKVFALQNDIRVATMSKTFLIETIIHGNNALMRLDTIEDEDEFGYEGYGSNLGGLDGFTDDFDNGEEE